MCFLFFGLFGFFLFCFFWGGGAYVVHFVSLLLLFSFSVFFLLLFF